MRVIDHKPQFIDRFNDLLAYDPESGLFRWKVTRGKAVTGAVAGSRRTDGYILIQVGAERFRAHRLAWFLVHGSWPSIFVDHINGDRADNRIANLREADHSENCANRKSGGRHKGVHWHIGARKYRAAIQMRGVVRHLGTFDTLDEAQRAYRQAAEELHGDLARVE